ALPAGLRVRSAAVVELDHAAVGRGPFVGAHPELPSERSGQLGEEPAAGAVRRNGAAPTAPGLLARAEVALEPALRGLAAALRGEDAGAAQAELPQRDLVLVLVTGGLVALLEPFVLLPVGQQVVGADVRGLQPLGPGLPVGGEDRVLAGQQRRLGDRGGLGARGAGEHRHPGPAAVARHRAFEDMRDQTFAAGLDTEVLTDLSRLGDLEQRLTGEPDGLGRDRIELGPRGAGAAGGCGRWRHRCQASKLSATARRTGAIFCEWLGSAYRTWRASC